MDMKILALFGVIILISVVDIGINIFSIIPGIGDLIETAGETVLEALQIALVGLILYLAGKE